MLGYHRKVQVLLLLLLLLFDVAGFVFFFPMWLPVPNFVTIFFNLFLFWLLQLLFKLIFLTIFSQPLFLLFSAVLCEHHHVSFSRFFHFRHFFSHFGRLLLHWRWIMEMQQKCLQKRPPANKKKQFTTKSTCLFSTVCVLVVCACVFVYLLVTLTCVGFYFYCFHWYFGFLVNIG